MPKSNVTINASFKKIQRSIITTSENGSVTTNQTNDSLVDVGETVELTLTPNQWCELESLTVTDSLGNNIPVNNNTFVMPADNVTVNAKFKEKNIIHDIIIDQTENGSVVTDVGPENVRVETPVNITITPNYGYELDTLVVTDEEGNNIEVTNNRFLMPITNARITATFKNIKKSVTLNNPEGGGVTTNQEDNSKVNVGDTVKLNLTPDENYELDKLTVTDEDENDVPVSNNSFIMPNSNVKVNATYRHITKAITISKSDNGKTNVNVENQAKVNAGEEVKITAEPNENYEVQEIIVIDEEGNKIEISSDNTFVMPTKNVIITTVFKYNKVNNDNNDNANNSTNSNIESSENNISDEVSEKENKTTDKKAILNTPKTGDKIVLVIAILVVATTIFIILSRKNKDKKERKKH